jgi:cob(I)alamin adenosyltransferase
LIGMLQLELMSAELHELLTDIQHDLFDLGGELCIPGMVLIKAHRALYLEQVLDKLNVSLAPLKEFILPGGSRASAVAHLVRSVCRRAERAIAALHTVEPVRIEALQYINRLSDLLFVLARFLNKADGGADVLWQKGRTTSKTAE